MKLPLFIAWRYLFAKKSHNVINIISIISSVGVALGTMALITVLSVYNGFEGLVKSLYNSYEPDILITPVKGKSFDPGNRVFNFLESSKEIHSVCEVVSENVFIKYRNSESVATIKGVDSSFINNTGMERFLTNGSFSLKLGEVEQAVVGRLIASECGINPNFLDPLYLYFPASDRDFSLINPSASLNSEKVYPSGIFSVEMGVDRKYIFIPIETARRLLGYDKEVTSLEIFLNRGADAASFEKRAEKALNGAFFVKNRYEQRETVYKMMKTEKLTIYIILIFILTIISFNIYGSLSMLVIEKGDDIRTLRSMGADSNTIKSLFLLEGWLISILGMAVGAVAGVTITLLQKYYGFISMPGNFIVDSYPVALKLSDIAFSVAGVTIIGYFAALIPLRILKNFEKF